MLKNRTLIWVVFLVASVVLSGALIRITWQRASGNRSLHAQIMSKAELVSQLGQETARIRTGHALDAQSSLRLRGVVDLSALLESSGASEPVLHMSTAPGDAQTQVISVDAQFAMRIEDLHGFLIKLRASDPIVRVHRMTITPIISERAETDSADPELGAPSVPDGHDRHIRLEAEMISSRLAKGEQ
tara:strand:+ start:54407 stop:54967 length:561 start_codon:yes stop_codon:yes gene_type:complete